jgi:hypothetical protein
MGNGGGRFVLRIPIPVPVFKYPEIWRLEGELKILNSKIADRNWVIGVKQTALNQMVALKERLNADAEANRRKIEELIIERDGLLNDKKRLEEELAQLRLSIGLANKENQIWQKENERLAKDYLTLTDDTTKRKQDIFNSIKVQNNLLLKTHTNMNSEYRTNDQKSFYQNEQMNFINLINFLFLIVYFILVLVFLYIIYYKPSITIYKKIFYAISLVLYPFLIMYIEFLIYFCAYFLFRMLSFDRMFEETS